MRRNGLTLEEVAAEFKVTAKTLHVWRKKHPAFNDALNERRDAADANVAKSLYQRACGILTKVKALDRNGNLVEVDLYEKPDVTACIFWLKNRRPDDWRDVRRVEHLTIDQVEAELQRILAEAANGR